MNGQYLNLMSFASELPNAIYGATQPGMGAGQSIPNYNLNPLNGNDFQILQIQVISQTTNPISSIPTTLVPNNPWLESNTNATRTLTFSPQTMGPTAINGPFLINNTVFNMDVINYSIPLNNTEVWTLQNNTPIAHPFHIHNVPFYILDINGVAPPPELAGRKDVVLVPAGQGTVRFITKFEDFANPDVPYMYHCHMLTHEDDGMMGQFIIYDPNSSVVELQNNKLTIFPNPASEEIQLVGGPKDLQFTIKDFLGKQVQRGFINDNSEINIQKLPAGIYSIEVLRNDQSIKSRFIKL
jgi:bilirubin oxidase